VGIFSEHSNRLYLQPEIERQGYTPDGDRNMGARNAYHELGPKIGILIFCIDTAKGSLAILIARYFEAPQYILLATGVAAVAGHNWPVFLGSGRRGEATTIGILLALVPSRY